MSLTVRRSTILELEAAPNIEDLLSEYAAESSIKGMPTPMAKMDLYKSLESIGVLYTLAAFFNDILVGCITILSPTLPHYSAIVAVAESFFVAKEYRGTGAGLKLLHAAESYAKEINSPGFLVSAPFGGDLAKILPNVGYTETNQVFFRGFY